MSNDKQLSGAGDVVELHPESLGVRSGPLAFYNVSETAAMMRLDESTLYRHLRNGDFPGLKIGGRYVVPAAVIERLVADVIATGRCLDLARWTDSWRRQQAAAVAAAASLDLVVSGGGE